MELPSLIEAMEATRVCILRYKPNQPNRGQNDGRWSATNAEGCDDSRLYWYRTAIDALDAMTGRRCTMTNHEVAVIKDLSDVAWAAEWRDGKWLRPFVPTILSAAQLAGVVPIPR